METLTEPQGSGTLSDGDTVDALIAGVEGGASGSPQVSPDAPRNRISALHTGAKWERGEKDVRDPTTKPPTLDEWTTFFGKVVLRVTCKWYLDYAFRGIDEDALSDREIDRLELTDDERKMIATPLAELSNKSKFMRKHGRMIVASGDAFNAMVVLGAWMSRVNRIAAKYRPRRTVPMKMNGASNHGGNRQDQSTAGGETYGTTGGRVPNGYPVYNPGSS